jgi:hypothetical protein
MNRNHRHRVSPYCLLFMVIFILFGVFGLAAFHMDESDWLYALLEPRVGDIKAFAMAAGVGGMLSLGYCVLLFILAADRRGDKKDRRRRAVDIAFDERRSDAGQRTSDTPATTHDARQPQTPQRTHPA